jgi:hypothetical protein
MKETTIDYIRGENYITYFSSDPPEIKHIRNLLEADPEVELSFDHTDQEDGGIEIRLPKKYYKRPKPPRKMSEEQKAKAGERLKQMWAEKRCDNEQEEES